MKKTTTIAVAVLIIATITFTIAACGNGGTTDEFIPVPNVMGLNYSDAIVALENAGFSITSAGGDAATILAGSVHNRTVLEGQVFRVNNEINPRFRDNRFGPISPDGNVIITFAITDHFHEPEPETEVELEIYDSGEEYHDYYDYINEEDSIDAVEEEAQQANLGSDVEILGTWIWMGQPYYIFEANGRGTMSGMAIRWSIDGNVLSICNTPELCGNNCWAPQEWYFEVDGNTLNLTSTLLSSMSFSYRRG